MTSEEPRGCLAAILKLFGIQLGEPLGEAGAGASNGELPYRLRDDFLSPAELSFYRVVRFALKERAVVCAKVNLADLFFVAQPKENQSFRNKIDRKHVDFLLCHPETMKPLVGVELDDASHRKTDRVRRDEFVDQVFAVAELPLIRVPARAAYDANALAAEFAAYLDGPLGSAASSPPTPPRRGAASPPAPPPRAPTKDRMCPKCGIPMVQRVVSKGENKGRQF
jgi:hypothetical protein